MALDSKVGTFTLTSGDSGTITITGVGFTPKVVLFFTSSTTLADTVTTDAITIIGGATSSTNEITWGQSSDDAVGTTDTHKWGDPSNCLRGYDGVGGADYLYSFNAFNSDGFVLNVTTAPGGNRVIGYMALGGADMVNAYFGSWDLSSLSGSQSKTGVGFQGNVAMFFGMCGANDGTASNECVGSLGIAVGAASEASVVWQDANGKATSQVDDGSFNDSIITDLNSTGTIGGEAEFTSFDADGITINVTTAFGGGRTANFLVMDITNVDVGEFTLQNSTGNFGVTGVGFQPDALFCMSAFNTGYTVTGGQTVSLGITDGTNQWFIGSNSEDGQGTTDVDRFSNDGELITRYDFAQTKQSSASIVSFDADGFTLNQTDAEDVTTRKVFYLALGGASAGNNIPQKMHHYTKNIGT